jgi:hypothetical protein
MSGSLHPNLAKLAASYDELLERYGRGLLSASAARAEILTLVARDDEGILWSIDPDTGSWMRRTRSGELVPGQPPAYGLATPTPHDLSGNAGSFRPDDRLELARVHDEHAYGSNEFTGTTRAPRLERARSVSSRLNRRSLLTWVLGAIAAVGCLIVVLFIAHG